MITYSIVIPAHNVRDCIGKAVKSVLTQTFKDFECIVVDDGSSDGTEKILDELAQNDGRLHIIHTKNRGVGSARNLGVEAANGEWVLFLDGDDLLAPGALENLVKIIDRYPKENLIRYGYKEFNDGEEADDVARSCNYSVQNKLVDISSRIDSKDYYVFVWQFVFRRALIAGMKFERYIRGEDRVFVIQTLCSQDSFVATDDVCYLYRKRQGSAVNSRASVQVLKDELSHRLDVVATIDNCGKRIQYAGNYWLEGWCLREYLTRVEADGYSPDERKELIAWFYRELPRMIGARGYTCVGKIYSRLYFVLRGSAGRYIVSAFLPLWAHRIKALINKVNQGSDCKV